MLCLQKEMHYISDCMIHCSAYYRRFRERNSSEEGLEDVTAGDTVNSRLCCVGGFGVDGKGFRIQDSRCVRLCGLAESIHMGMDVWR
jgi:hypothetical protein